MDVESHLHSSKSISIILTFLLAFFNDYSHMCQTRTPIPLNQLLLNILLDNEPINRTPWKHFQCSEVKDFTSVHHNCIKNNSWICFSSSLSSFGKHSSFSLTWQNAQVLRPYFTEENQKCILFDLCLCIYLCTTAIPHSQDQASLMVVRLNCLIWDSLCSEMAQVSFLACFPLPDCLLI